MAKIMNRMAWLSVLVTGIFIVLYGRTEHGTALALAITFGTTSYHLVMRLVVGAVFDLLLKNHVDHRRRWFRVSEAEQAFYKKIKVKKWKGKMPAYDPGCFDRSIHTWDEIAQAMCQAELVHEVIMILSFLPILAAIRFGALFVFVATSVLAAGYDAMFVIMQRYNRPRIVKLLEKTKKQDKNAPPSAAG